MSQTRKVIPNGEPHIITEGKLGAIVGFPMLVDMGNGHVEKTFERFVRPPGTRIIAIRNTTIFLQKEHRQETKNGFDWRLPGGKVVDSFEEYKTYLGKEMPEQMIIAAGRRELQEEAQLDTQSITVFKKSTCGASVEWDLYYLIAENTVPYVNNHNEGEEIIDGKWFTYEEVLSMCISGEIDEDRTVATLYQFIESRK
jgi:8-oxo-dGTP pyrophosphatase MutT (NUDIX family)